MEITENVKNILIRWAIAIIVMVIAGIYYLSELRPFPYEEYEKEINQIQRFDAELNEAIVLLRFGILKFYDPIVQAVDRSDQVMAILKENLIAHPNPSIDVKFKSFEETIKKKKELTQKFERINPVLINAILNFSTILSKVIESESNNQLVESCLEQDYKTEQVTKANNLFRGILIYVNQRSEEKHNYLVELVADIRKAPQKLPNLEQALTYADKILELQPQMTEIDEALFQVPIVPKLNELLETYNLALKQFQAQGDAFRIILYVLIFVLLVVLRWTFARLQNTVTTLHIEVKRKVKAQKELAKINRQLENRVAQRTHELTVKNKDLNQALGDLKEAQEQLIMQEKMASVGMLTTGIAHEIKNPLNFVNNFSDISIELVTELDQELAANQEKITKDTFTYIQEILTDLKTNCSKIKEHGVRADNIVKNMLLHSQEAGVEKEMIDVQNMMDDNIQIAIESFKATSPKFEVKLEKDYSPTLPKVLGAPQAIGRLFVYLIDNALYALRERQQTAEADYQPILMVSIQQVDQNVVIKVRDNGTGIPKKNLDKVFEPFFTTKPTGKGNTGLGLSICYDTVVKQHKGELRVNSEEGVYTEFTVVLPINTRNT
ncbi:MAG: GHKL domain-containing protein [Gammaproteobacteria bacterium]|jgi:signal transduction histidine kinase|nr:GHKL domain-containing protein [Gammaproteobacteria bacterium]